MRRMYRAGFGLALATALACLASGVEAQTTDQLIQSLQPHKSTTRGLMPAQTQTNQQTRDLVNSLKGKTTRQITVEQRTEIAKVVKESNLPSVDLEIFFDYDSAAITETARPKLDTLGKALSSDKLKGAIFLIGGHTDARGTDAYNQSLSERRADSVRSFLIAKYHLSPQALIAVGYGEEQLKNTGDPDATENRRVQVVNIATQ